MGILLRSLVAAGLAVDAVVHWKYAPDMAYVPGGAIGGDTLFKVQAVVAAVVAVLICFVARRWTYAVAFLVAASALGALLLYYYVDVGEIWPFPEMHDPMWYWEKTASVVGEGIAAVAAVAGFLVAGRERSPEGERARS
ncbi:hypothetical protein [Spirillospora sp. CA-294931]|uniref:hypothetical protein n=1 Tax=Spirillospora sp. CA-294931 TaxID=3240042 RepID=UPI003D927675